MNLSITFLGTGTSTGIPMLGCNCSVCTSTNPFNKRLRTSFLLKTNKSTVIFDTGPDLRTQLLKNDVQDVTAVIISHSHADHLNGIDDIRPFTFKHPINLYTSKECAKTIHQRFGYIFGNNKGHIGSSPKLIMNEIELEKSTNVAELDCEFIELPHGNGTSLGLITNGLAIISDCHEIPPATLEKLKAVKLKALIIDCVREEPHRTHLNVEKCFKYIKEIGAQQSFLTHMGHELEHDSLQVKCDKHFPTKNVKVAYDGMKFDV